MAIKSGLRTTALFSLAVSLAHTPAQAETLSEALAKAYRTNPTLTAARAQQRANDENVPINKANGRPEIALSGEYGELVKQTENSAGLLTSPKRSASASAQISVPLYSGGSVRNAINAAKLRVEAGRADLRGTEASVFSRVVAAYLDVIRATAIVGLNQQNVSALTVNLRASSDRFQVGDLTRTDVAQSESRLSLAQADLERAEADLISAKENYVALVGSAPDSLESPSPLPNLPSSPEGAVAVALTDNPDIQAANKVVEATGYDVKVAKAQAAPRLSAFTRGNYTDYLNSEKKLAFATPGTIKNATVGATITLPLYQGGRPAALARQNTARQSQAIENAIETERSVIAQTRSAYASWQASLRAIESTKKAVSATALALEGVRAENTAGTRTILDILDAQQEALSARVQLVTAERNAYVAAFTLLAAIGHAQAQDLNFDGGALFNPLDNYNRVNDKFIDFDFDPKPVPQATRTTAIPSQDGVAPPASAMMP